MAIKKIRNKICYFGGNITTLASMKKKKKIVLDLESVKIKKSIVDKVREYKSKTGVSISAFFEIAADEFFMQLKQAQKDNNG